MIEKAKVSLLSPLFEAGFFNVKKSCLLKLFRKSTALVLAFTFLCSQILWAADVRQMLLDAKFSFEEDQLRRTDGMTAEDLQTAQSDAQSVIDQQNALQDLEGMNFSLTTQNGDILQYIGNTLSKVTRPDGTILKNIQLDANGNIINANLKLLDGSIQVFQNGQVIGYQTPDGSQIIYENGQIQEVISKDGTETLYTYIKDESGNVTETLLESPSFVTRYDAQGQLKETLSKNDGTKTFYVSGILDRIEKADGTVYFFKSEPAGSDTVVTLESVSFKIGLPDGSVLEDIVWGADDRVEDARMVCPDGSVYIYQDKQLTESRSAAGTVTAYAYSADRITTSSGGVIYEYLLDGTLLKSTDQAGLVCTFLIEGPYKGLKEKESTPQGIVYLFEYQINTDGSITAQRRELLTSNYVVTSNQTTTISDRNNAYQPANSLIRTDFLWNQNATKTQIQFVATQQRVGDILRTLTVTYLSGKWTFKRSDKNVLTGRTTTATTTISQTLGHNIQYIAELRLEGSLAKLYVYPKGSERPAVPAGTLSAFEAPTKLTVSLKNISGSGYILKNPQALAVSAVTGKPLTDKIHYLKNLLLTKSDQGFSESALEFTSLTYDASSLLKEIVKKDGTRLFFEAGMLKQALDSAGNPVNFNFTESSLSNIVGAQIAQNGVTSSYDAEGRLSSIFLNGMTIHYKSDSNTIDSIEKEDGTELYNLTFGENGEILNAEIVMPDGRIRVYENGHLVKTKEPDQTQLFYFDDKPLTLITPQNLTYNFSYTPEVIEAVLGTPEIPDALTPVKMEYDQDFNLLKVIRQNEEILNYLDNELWKIEYPNDSPQVFTYEKDENGNVLFYTVTQGNVETLYNAQNQAIKSTIHPTEENPHTLEVIYRYGKIREIYKDGVLTFKYSYSFGSVPGFNLAPSEELTHIEDLEEKTTKIYKDGNLLTSFSNETSVLSTYSYVDGKVSEVKVARLGRVLHAYAYSYEGNLTIVTDEEGVIRTYDASKDIVFLEKDGLKYAYTYHDQDGEKIVAEALIEQTLENGSLVHYNEGQVTRIDLADGTYMTDVILDGARNFLKATVHLPDGTRKVFNGQTILEEITPDETHFFFDGGKISKVIDAQGNALEYSYEKDASGNVTAIWVKKGQTNLKYTPGGGLIGFKLTGVPVKVIDELSNFYDSAHTYQGGTNGPYSIDQNFSSAQTGGYYQADGGGGVTLYSTHTFTSAKTVNSITFKMYAHGEARGDYIRWTEANYRVEVFRSGVWETVPGSSQSYSTGGDASLTFDSGQVTLTNLNLTGVTAIRAYAQGYGNCSGSTCFGGGTAYIYELSADVTSDVRDFVDSSDLRHVLTPQGQVKVTTSQKQAGKASAYFDGLGDFLSIPDSNEWDFGTGDFALEGAVRFASKPASGKSAALIDVGGTAGVRLSLQNNSGTYRFHLVIGNNNYYVNWNPGLNTWYNFALSRQGSTVKILVDGVQVGANITNSSNLINLTGGVRLGDSFQGGQGLNGYLDEVKISAGSQTKLLAHFDGIDNAYYQFINNASGYKFNGDGGELLFDLTGNYLLTNANSPDPLVIAGLNQASQDLNGSLSSFINAPYFDRVNVSVPAGLAGWFSTASQSILGSQELAVQEYSEDGVLETQTKADQTVTLFNEQNKPVSVLDKDGTLLIQYFYDEEGHPSRVYLKNARDVLPDEILKAKEAIESERAKELLALAQQKNLIYDSIFSTANTQKEILKIEENRLDAAFTATQNIKVYGSQARAQKADILSQIQGGINSVFGYLIDVSKSEADAYSSLDSQLKAVSDQIEADSQAAFTELAIQETNLKNEILRQEVSPIVYDYYRRILGRDPSSSEYDFWVQKTNYDSGENGADISVYTAPLPPPVDPQTLAFKEAGGQLSVEAESYYTNINGPIHSWTKDSFGYLVAGPDNNTNYNVTLSSSPRLDYKVNFSKTGTYYLWVRGYATDGASDSINAGVDGVLSPIAQRISNFTYGSNSWTNKNMSSVVITLIVTATGDHTLNFWMREDGFKFDKFILTQDPSFIPSGTSLPESSKVSPPPVNVPTQSLTSALIGYLNTLPELQERQAYVQSIKQKVTDKINQYLLMSQADREVFAQALGLSANELIAVSASDSQKILTWLESRSLHFGQSAFLSLESLLDQKGISYAREDIAEKAILIDILSGVITPLDDGDLVISVFSLNKVASLYGLALSGANLTWEDLLSIYQANPNARVIAHINGNHFIIITGIQADRITYIDPGIGKDKQNESLIVAKEGFLKAWKGNVTGDSVILSDAKQREGSQVKIISAEETMKIRGAFWGSLLNFLGFVFNIILPGSGIFFYMAAFIASVAEGDWMSGISSIVSIAFGGFDIVKIFEGSFQGMLNSLGPLGQIVNGIGQFFGNVYSAVTGFFGAISDGIGGFLQGVLGVSSNIAAQIAQTAVSIGVNFGVSKGLETLGVNPEIAGFLGSLAAGAVVGGLKGDTVLQSGQVITQTQHIQQSLQQVITLNQVGRLGLELGLDSSFTNIIGLSLSAIQGQFIDGTVSNLSEAFSNIKPELFSSLGLWGIDKLGTSLGLDSGLAMLMGAPILAGLGAAFQGGVDVGTNIINSVQAGLIQGAIAYGLSFSGTTSPLIGSLLSRDVTQNLALAIGRDGLFNTVFNILGNTVSNLFNMVGGVVRSVGEGISTFGNALATQGPIGALESFLGSIFGASATQPVYEAGGVEEFLQSSTSYSYTMPSGEQVNEYVLTGDDSIFFGTDGSFAGLKRDDVYEFGMFELTDNEILRLWEGDIYSDIEDGLQLYAQVEKGELIHFDVRDGDNVLLEANPGQQDSPIYIEAPNPQDPNSSFNFWGAVFNLVPMGLSFFVDEGTAYAGEIKINSTPLSSLGSVVDIALLNGMRFLEWGIKEGTAPPYFESGNPFRNKLNSLGVNDDSIKPIPLFEGFGRNVFEWFQLQTLTGEIRNAFIQIRQNQGSTPFVPLAYSGAGRPLLQVLSDPYFIGIDPFNGFDVKTAVLVGVPMLQGENVIKSPTLERIINIYGTNDPGLYTSDTKIPSIPKIYTHTTNAFETINIELKDISHIEYFYKNGENPPLKQIRASNFIARLTQASLSVDQLEGFLRQFAPTPTTETYLDSSTNKVQTVRTYVVDLENLPNV